VIRLSTLKTLALTALAAICVSACVTATPYQPRATGAAQSDGYSETKVEQDRWRITFTGNSLTPRDTVENYLLYRAAELTVAQGKDWFMMVERGLSKTEEKIILPTSMVMSPLWGPPQGVYQGRWQPVWHVKGGHGWSGPIMSPVDQMMYGSSWNNQDNVQTLKKYEAYCEIFLGTGPKPTNDPKAFDAKQVIENLGPKVVRPTPKP